VKRLADDLRQTYGHINVLVNDIWGAEVLKGGPSEWNTPCGSMISIRGLRILRLGIDTHLITAHHLLPLVVSQAGGLLVELTDGTFDGSRPTSGSTTTTWKPASVPTLRVSR
jgi:hypothetical protein